MKIIKRSKKKFSLTALENYENLSLIQESKKKTGEKNSPISSVLFNHVVYAFQSKCLVYLKD